MSPSSIRQVLGPLPLLRGLFRWSLAVVFTAGAWHIYLLAPVPGLVAIGLAPVISIFCFFRGLNLVGRTLPYWKTRLHIRKLGMNPTWWDNQAGYFVIDEQQGLWIVNGSVGTIPGLIRLHGHSDWMGHRLELYAKDDACPTACYGFGSEKELKETAERFQKACSSLRDCPLPVTYEDTREQG